MSHCVTLYLSYSRYLQVHRSPSERVRVIKCGKDRCYKKYVNEPEERASHYRKYHSTTGASTCPVCQLVLYGLIVMYEHLLSAHFPQGRCSIDGCNKLIKLDGRARSYKGRYKVLRHLHFVHNIDVKRYPCEKCKALFVTEKAHKEHLTKFHAENALRCTECDYETSRMACLQTHRNAYHKKKMYHCDQCNFGTSWPASLLIHKNSAHSGKRYECKYCPMTFTQSYSVTRHVKTAHKI